MVSSRMDIEKTEERVTGGGVVVRRSLVDAKSGNFSEDTGSAAFEAVACAQHDASTGVELSFERVIYSMCTTARTTFGGTEKYFVMAVRVLSGHVRLHFEVHEMNLTNRTCTQHMCTIPGYRYDLEQIYFKFYVGHITSSTEPHT